MLVVLLQDLPTQTTVMEIILLSTTSTGGGAYWFFGDGTHSLDLNPTHTFTANGSYTVTLQAYVMPDSTCIDTHTETITVTGVGTTPPDSSTKRRNSPL